MKKLKLNKMTISVLDKTEMGQIDGGATCIASCARGTRNGKDCCNSGRLNYSLSGVDSGKCSKQLLAQDLKLVEPMQYMTVKHEFVKAEQL